MKIETEMAMLGYLKLSSIWHYVLRAYPMNENILMRELIDQLQSELHKSHAFYVSPLFETAADRWDHLTDQLYHLAYPPKDKAVIL